MTRIVDMMLGGGPNPDEVLRYRAIVLKVVSTQDGKDGQDKQSIMALTEALAFFTDNPDLCAYMTVWGQGIDKEVGQYITKALGEVRRNATEAEWVETLAEGRAMKDRIFNVETASYNEAEVKHD